MERNLKNWLEKGLITEEKYFELLEDLKTEKEKFRKTRNQITLYLIGAILLGIGVILFISANDWLLEFLNRCNVLKIILMLVLSIGSLFLGYKLSYEKSKFPKLGTSLIFLSTLLIGGTYALFGQIYQIEANCPLIYFLWFLSIYPLSFIFKNMAINVLSVIVLILSIIFYYGTLEYDVDFIWIVFIPIIIGSGLYLLGMVEKIEKNYNNFSLFYKITGIFSIFISLMILTFEQKFNDIVKMEYILPVICLIGLYCLNYFSKKEKTYLNNIETMYFCSILFYLTIIMISYYFAPIVAVVFSNVLIIVLIKELFDFGYKFENTKLVDLAIKFLIIYLLIYYIRFGGEYLKGASFFIIGGIILISSGLYFERKKKTLLKAFKENQK